MPPDEGALVTPATQRIPFNRASLVGNELEYIRQSVESRHISGDGTFSKRCEQLLQQLLGVPRALLATSCTDALEMSGLLLDLEPGDEVIVPSFTFVSTINAYVLRGARPVFIDVRPDTLNLDERLLESLITPRTKAVVPVHYGGVGCEMDEIMDIAGRHGIAVVEDNAHGLFGYYKGQLLGTFGAMATQSFHETKNFSSGEGGALLINDPQYVERAEIIREKGTDRSRFLRGQVDKYTWVDVGSSHLPSDILAAFLLAQLEERESIQERRAKVWQRYRNGLSSWANAQGVSLPFIPEHCDHPSHLFYLLLPDEARRDEFISYMSANDMAAVFHYLPLNVSPMGRQFGGQPGDCPVTEDVSGRLVRLPFYTDLSPEDQDRIIEVISAFKC
jgi:dTDP-4-amino-4,6-dideoxygalactose transaminase